MNCPAIHKNLLVYLDGEATPEETQRIERHLKNCAACRSELDQLARLQPVLRQNLQLLAEETAPSPEAWAVIQSRWKNKEYNMNHQPVVNARPARVGKKSLVWSALLVVLLLIGLFGLVPEARVQAEQYLKQIAFGLYSFAAQVDPQAQAPAPDGALPDDVWRIETEIGNFAGDAPKGQKAAVASFSTVEEARAQTKATILILSTIPDGYVLKEVKVAAMGKGLWSFLFYTGPGRDIIIVQMPVGRVPNADPNRFDSVAARMMTSDTLEEVDFDGRTAAWIAGHTLMWADGDVSYQVGGRDLTLEQAKAIARSLK